MIMATTIAREETVTVDSGRGRRGPVGKPRIGWALGGLSMLAIVAVVVAIAVFSRGATTTPDDQGRVAPLYTQDELAVLRLVERGVLPDEVLDAEPFRTKQLVNEGVLPRATLSPGSAPVTPLYCPEERALMAAVAAGVVPDEVLDGEPFRTNRLINQGLVPRAAAAPC
jgi:hypothetical protein